MKHTKEEYAKYLESDHWKSFRKEVLRRDRCRCRQCSARGTQVHHLIYRDNWEDAQIYDCVTLCRRCHENQHGIDPKPISQRIKKTKKWKRIKALKKPKPGPAPWKYRLNFTKRPHYVNRGTSSN